MDIHLDKSFFRIRILAVFITLALSGYYCDQIWGQTDQVSNPASQNEEIEVYRIVYDLKVETFNPDFPKWYLEQQFGDSSVLTFADGYYKTSYPGSSTGYSYYNFEENIQYGRFPGNDTLYVTDCSVENRSFIAMIELDSIRVGNEKCACFEIHSSSSRYTYCELPLIPKNENHRFGEHRYGFYNRTMDRLGGIPYGYQKIRYTNYALEYTIRSIEKRMVSKKEFFPMGDHKNVRYVQPN